MILAQAVTSLQNPVSNVFIVDLRSWRSQLLMILTIFRMFPGPKQGRDGTILIVCTCVNVYLVFLTILRKHVLYATLI